MFDILTALLGLFKQTKDISTPQGTQHWTTWIQDLGQMIQRGESLSHSYVYMHLRPQPPPVVGTKVTLSAVLQHFHAGHHRVLVQGDKDEVVAVLSQSQVLAFLASNIHLVDAATAQMTVAAAGLGKLKPHSITAEVSALHAFDTLHRLKVHALPIVDRSDSLLGNLSIADLRAVPSLAALGPFLSHTVSEYVVNFSQAKLPVLTCRPTTTLETIILKMAAAKVLRLWCVDERNSPVGVVALSDLMSFLYARLDA